MLIALDILAIDIPGGADALGLIACVALTAAVLLFVFFIEPDASDSAPHRGRLDQLLERRDVIYDNLRDLKFEHRTGKFAEEDYEQMKQTLENEAAQVLAEIEKGLPQPPSLNNPFGQLNSLRTYRGQFYACNGGWTRWDRTYDDTQTDHSLIFVVDKGITNG